MEWIIHGSDPPQSVPVPDHLLIPLVAELRRAPAHLDIDPYKDRSVRDELPAVIESLARWVQERGARLRENVMQRLGLRRWQAWADAALDAARAADDELRLGMDLVELCEAAAERGMPVLVAGD